MEKITMLYTYTCNEKECERDMKKIDRIIEDMFFETEKTDALKYFENSELNEMMHEKLSDDDFMDFEEKINEFACNLAQYWYMQGFYASREILNGILGHDENEKARTL